METLIQQLKDGQAKLEWAIGQTTTQTEADRTTFTQAMQAQADNLLKLAEGQTQLMTTLGQGRPTAPPPGTVVPLQKYAPGDEPLSFFQNFERAARASSWPGDRWPFYLAPLLTGEAQAAYQMVNRDGNCAYALVKQYILDRLGVDDETHRLRFRQE